MKFTIDHFNINVLDLDKSLAFYDKALGLKEARRKRLTTAVLLSYISKTASAPTNWN